MRERDTRLQLAMEAGRAGTFHHDLSTDRVTWSAELEQILGYEPGTFGGDFTDFQGHIHPQDAAHVQAKIQSAIANCAEYDFEFRVLRVDGTLAWLAGRGRAYAQVGQSADTITGVAFDVTARRDAEEKLRNREQQLSLAQRAGGLGLWDWDIAVDRATWSDRAWQLFEPGSAGGVVTYARWLARVHPDDRKRASAVNERARSGSPYRDEFRVVHPDGSVHWLEAFADTILDSSGAPRRMVGFVRDITERKAAEAALRASELRFRQMSEVLPQIVFTCEPDGRCEWANGCWYQYTGRAEFSDENWFDCMHPDDRTSVRDLWRHFAQSPQPFSAELRLRRADGAYCWHLCRVVPVRDASGNLVQWVGSSNDINAMRTEANLREKLMEAERAARAHAEIENHLKDEFLATLSHELRTPLANVISWTRLLQKQFATAPESLRRGLSIVLDNATAQSKIIGDMLDMNRIARGKVTLDVGVVRLGAFVDSCCASHRLTAEAKGVTIEYGLHLSDDVIVLADRGRLQQVLGNLLSNAIKFTPQGGLITVSVGAVDNWYEIVVSDTGEGIAPESVPYVFERFRQGAGNISRRHGGLGLGLAIVRQLVMLHGGEVAVASEGLGHGATFTVRLPARQASIAGAAAVSTGPEPRNPQAEPLSADFLVGTEVLVVDDEPAILEYTANLLAEHGASVRGFGSAEQVIEAVRELGNDWQGRLVLVTDLGLKGMSGVTLVTTLRTQLGLGSDRVSALAVTAFAREEDREDALAAGFQEYLTKPYEATQLITAVRHLAVVARHSR